MTTPLFKQQGIILVTSLIMLAVMLLLAVSSINMSTVNLRITNNMQQQQEAEMAVNMALEQQVGGTNAVNNFGSTCLPANATITASQSADNTAVTYPVKYTAKNCVWSGPSPGWSKTLSYSPTGTGVSGRQDTDWIISAQIDPASPAASGANPTIVMGVRSLNRLTSCPTTCP